ncbi:hypothetical protein O166_12175 [Pseudogulbenkiania ferrooxidans EGD-HP2]|uniref:Uncharacterized protein n=1 Tax=Pseudogulbenkiania ferrooxidans EGD-HP2 TaxID=1388764 RepID=A0ABP2XJN9_9NEIS|nr:hypothetical protein O166_12175 [Pseudogulbenkiania ferrooxidans EGD-HP2]
MLAFQEETKNVRRRRTAYPRTLRPPDCGSASRSGFRLYLKSMPP